MPKSYIGVKNTGRGVLDWAGLTEQLGEDITQAINTRQLERQAFDEIEQNNLDAINSYEIGQDQSFNEFIMNGANNARDIMYEWSKAAKSGEMTQAEYKRRMNNVMTSWDSLAGAGKTFDERHAQVLERQQPGKDGRPKGSQFERYINQMNAANANLGSKTFYINPLTGKGYLAELDENGQVYNANDVRQMNNPGNLLDDYLDLPTAINGIVENWGTLIQWKDKGGGKTLTVEDIRNRGDYELMVEKTANSYMTNSRNIAKILVDNGAGDYQFYTSDEERDSKIENELRLRKNAAERARVEFNESEVRSELEDKFIYVTKDQTGVWQPQPTPEQEEAAKERIVLEINSQLLRKEQGTRGFAPSGGGSGSGSGGDAGGDYAKYATAREGWREGDVSKLNSTALPGYRFRFAGDNIIVEEYQGMQKVTDEYGDVVGEQPRWLTVNNVLYSKRGDQKGDLRDLSQYIFKPGMSKGREVSSQTRFDESRRAFSQSQGGGTSQPKETLNW